MSALCWLTPGGCDPDGITPSSGTRQDADDLISAPINGNSQTYKHYFKLTIFSQSKTVLASSKKKKKTSIIPPSSEGICLSKLKMLKSLNIQCRIYEKTMQVVTRHISKIIDDSDIQICSLPLVWPVTFKPVTAFICVHATYLCVFVNGGVDSFSEHVSVSLCNFA